MRFPPSPAFEAERLRYDLQFTCEQCAHFEPHTSSCAHFYPTRDHLGATRDALLADIVFCKEFELR